MWRQVSGAEGHCRGQGDVVYQRRPEVDRTVLRQLRSVSIDDFHFRRYHLYRHFNRRVLQRGAGFESNSDPVQRETSQYQRQR